MKLLPCALGPALTVEEALTLSSNFSSPAALPEKTSGIALTRSGPISSHHTDFLFAYDIFPRFLMRADAQWIRERRSMRVGDIIVQRAVLPPIGFGLCAEFAVRVSALISEPSQHIGCRGLADLFSLVYQKWCTQQALKHVKQRFESCNPNI
jgi:hypothetical protein